MVVGGVNNNIIKSWLALLYLLQNRWLYACYSLENQNVLEQSEMLTGHSGSYPRHHSSITRIQKKILTLSNYSYYFYFYI